MARKLKNPAAATPPGAPGADADNPLADLETAMPDVELKFGDHSVTVQEYRLKNGLRARVLGAPIVADLQVLAESGEAKDAGIETYLDILAKHADLTHELLVLSVGAENEEFIDGLVAADARQLLIVWWSVCGRFFWASVVARLRDRTLLQIRRMGTESAGPKSSASPPASAEPNSGSSPTVTPSVN